MAHYAESTRVGTAQSRGEIERTLRRYGADAFGYVEDRDRAVIVCRMRGRQLRFVLPLPDPGAPEFAQTRVRGLVRSVERQREAFVQATRQRWRALLLVVKAKLEAVEAGIETFDDAFLANIVLPDRRTVGEFLRPQIESAYKSGQMPPLLPWHGPGNG
jgi:hypothetical protein